MRIFSVLLFLLIFFAMPLSAQDTHTFTTPKQMPEFPGGTDALMQFVRRTTNTSLLSKKEMEEIQRSPQERKVICGFRIDTLGFVKNVEVLSSLHPVLDEEAMRVTSLLPRFNPAKIYSADSLVSERIYPATYTIPILFEDYFPKDSIYSYKDVDIDPEFPEGNIEGFTRFISKHQRDFYFPVGESIASMAGPLGQRIICDFIVDKEGDIHRIKILKSGDGTYGYPYWDPLALTILAQMPKWKPGRKNGKAVSVSYRVLVLLRES